MNPKLLLFILIVVIMIIYIISVYLFSLDNLKFKKIEAFEDSVNNKSVTDNEAEKRFQELQDELNLRVLEQVSKNKISADDDLSNLDDIKEKRKQDLSNLDITYEKDYKIPISNELLEEDKDYSIQGELPQTQYKSAMLKDNGLTKEEKQKLNEIQNNIITANKVRGNGSNNEKLSSLNNKNTYIGGNAEIAELIELMKKERMAKLKRGDSSIIDSDICYNLTMEMANNDMAKYSGLRIIDDLKLKCKETFPELKTPECNSQEQTSLTGTLLTDANLNNFGSLLKLQ